MALASGVNTRLPKSATAMLCPAVTGVPLKVSDPAVGKVVMNTAINALADESAASAKPKSAAEKVRLPSSVTVSVLLVPVGASLTGLRLKLTLSLSESTPSLVVMVSVTLP